MYHFSIYGIENSGLLFIECIADPQMPICVDMVKLGYMPGRV